MTRNLFYKNYKIYNTNYKINELTIEIIFLLKVLGEKLKLVNGRKFWNMNKFQGRFQTHWMKRKLLIKWYHYTLRSSLSTDPVEVRSMSVAQLQHSIVLFHIVPSRSPMFINRLSQKYSGHSEILIKQQQKHEHKTRMIVGEEGGFLRTWSVESLGDWNNVSVKWRHTRV